MKKLTIIILIAFNANLFAQVRNDNETNFPSEGSIHEGRWGTYMLNNEGTSRTVRIGVSNDGYTRAEIELENNNTANGTILFKTSNLNNGALNRMIITNEGKIGIGTLSPGDYKLNVNGNTFVNGTFTSSSLNIDNSNIDLHLYKDNDVGDWTCFRTNKGNGIALIGQPDVVSIAISRTNSNVSIGTKNISPDYKLSVNGKIRAKEIKVEANWADFVFDDNYNLRTLSEVKSYIKENNHLPDIPTSKEVEQNGISIGEMNSKLLQKIEELTLYLIEQNEKISDLENEIIRLKKASE